MKHIRKFNESKGKKYLVQYFSESGTQSDNEFIGVYDDYESAKLAKEEWIHQNIVPKEELDKMLDSGKIDQYEYDDHLDQYDYYDECVVIEEILPN